MNELLQALQTLLAGVEALKYIDADWGQLNLEQPPVKYPCAVIGIESAEYGNMGNHAQQGAVRFSVTIAQQRLNRTNAGAKSETKERAAEFWTLYHDVSDALHCRPLGIENFGSPVRTEMRHSVNRGLDLIEIIFTVAYRDYRQFTTVAVSPELSITGV